MPEKTLARIANQIADAAHDAGWTETSQAGVSLEEPYVAVTVSFVPRRTIDGLTFPEAWTARVYEPRLQQIAETRGPTPRDAMHDLYMHLHMAYALERRARAIGCAMFCA